jgi:hypothetical protein
MSYSLASHDTAAVEAQRQALADRVAALLPRVEATRGALADMRDWLQEIGYVNAQDADPAVVVKRIEQRFPGGGVESFLTGY